MGAIENYSSDLRFVLKKLIERKSERDRKNFTIYQLAKAIDMPHSMLVKLVHVDPAKRVNNPRIDTLARIVDFFRQDGFSITLDELLANFKTKPAIEVNEQNLGLFSIDKSVMVYSMDAGLEQSVGNLNIKLTTNPGNTIALLSDEDIKPMFKKGSVFIVDTTMEPEHDTLVAVRINGHNKILIRKFYIEGHKKILRSYDTHIAPIELMPTINYKIVGVVLQVNAKT